ncbi:hypothetical protein [Suttonella indologenes]|uniref:hypothetical protein n=1 Tax=Suttonella indologenes TaxID=13276 RepID=UPI001FE85FFD|nr:hypothetical protein [Suttonella indologenes]
MLANYRRNLEQWQEPYRDCARDELAQALGTAIITAQFLPSALICSILPHWYAA